MAVRVTLAGQVGIELDGVVVAEDVLGRPGRIAVAYLACERHRPVPRDELADGLWGNEPPRSWEQLLRGIVSKLRACLSVAGLVPAYADYCVRGLPATPASRRSIDVEETAASLEAAITTTEAGRSCELAARAAAVASRQFLPGGAGP